MTHPDEDADQFPLLHIWGQPSHHMPARIFGNRAGLEALRKAIDEELHDTHSGEETFFQSDGEGYEIEVRLGVGHVAARLPASYTGFPSEWTHEERVSWNDFWMGHAYPSKD